MKTAKCLIELTILLALTGCSKKPVVNNTEPDVEYDLYLLIGQSNMVGYAPLEQNDTLDIRGVYLLDSEGKIIPASAPINRFSTIRFMGDTYYGLGSSFGKALRFKTGRYILLVSNARGGSAIYEWQKESSYNFYSEALRRTQEALSISGVHLKAILWHQGESDCTRPDFESYYFPLLSQMIDDFRNDFNQPDLPIVVGETYYGATYASQMNPVINKVSEYINNSACVSAEGCGTLGDNIHFNHEGYDILGERYAQKILELCYPELAK